MTPANPHSTAREESDLAPGSMTDDDLLDELMFTVRLARSHGTWDRERLRAVSAEVRARDLVPGLSDPPSARA